MREERCPSSRSVRSATAIIDTEAYTIILNQPSPGVEIANFANVRERRAITIIFQPDNRIGQHQASIVRALAVYVTVPHGIVGWSKENAFDLRNFYGAGIFENILELQTLESKATGILKMCVLWKV